jgi:hypothetical protein
MDRKEKKWKVKREKEKKNRNVYKITAAIIKPVRSHLNATDPFVAHSHAFKVISYLRHSLLPLGNCRLAAIVAYLDVVVPLAVDIEPVCEKVANFTTF